MQSAFLVPINKQNRKTLFFLCPSFPSAPTVARAPTAYLCHRPSAATSSLLCASLLSEDRTITARSTPPGLTSLPCVLRCQASTERPPSLSSQLNLLPGSRLKSPRNESIGTNETVVIQPCGIRRDVYRLYTEFKRTPARSERAAHHLDRGASPLTFPCDQGYLCSSVS